MVTQIDQVKGEIRALQPDNRKTLNLV
jgi:hypothetical protein